MLTIRTATIIALLASTASASPVSDETVSSAAPQVQLDLGLSVICAGYEHPVSDHVAVFVGAGIFGTYFLPWFDRGDEVIGAVGDARVSWFARTDGAGLYITPYVRAGYASGTDDDTDMTGGGPVVTAGAFVGWAFRLTKRLDLRLGVGAQYIFIDGKNGVGASTPFAGIDGVLGFRL